MCVSSVFFLLLAPRAASGSDPSTRWPHMGWNNTTKDPESPSAWWAGSLGVLRLEPCDFEDLIGVESVHFLIFVHQCHSTAVTAAGGAPAREESSSPAPERGLGPFIAISRCACGTGPLTCRAPVSGSSQCSPRSYAGIGRGQGDMAGAADLANLGGSGKRGPRPRAASRALAQEGTRRSPPAWGPGACSWHVPTMGKAECNCDRGLYEYLLLGLVHINTLSAIVIGFTET